MAEYSADTDRKPLSAADVIERLCKLQAEVYERTSDGCNAADCFCGKGGFWGTKSYGGTFEEGYRNDGKALEFIERAVREALGKLSSSVHSPSEDSGK